MSLTAALQQRSAMVSGMVRTSLGESFALPSRPGSAAAMLLCDQERRSLHRAMETIALVDKREAVNCAANVLMPTLKPSKMKRASSAAAGRVGLQRK
ncbi:Hypothetical protein, putative [Bodo saltans]|uniref:Uncharacterized protein n=1 Tax=Bodo saltans TaxID=75058 RepID=A0A0S4INT5_BODSA|nr:Hypothetical protein, putative [Bodo saltans]|eukprot:CUE71831.1 Hypothetical protein, putative [Bodo saltans]